MVTACQAVRGFPQAAGMASRDACMATRNGDAAWQAARMAQWTDLLASQAMTPLSPATPAPGLGAFVFGRLAPLPPSMKQLSKRLTHPRLRRRHRGKRGREPLACLAVGQPQKERVH